MTSETYPALGLLAALIVLSQLHALLFFSARIKIPALRKLLRAVYLLFNLSGFSAFLAFQALELPGDGGLIRNYLYLPGIVWQSVHLVWIVPGLVLSALTALVSLLLSAREPKGLPKLFRAKKNEPSLAHPAGLLLCAFLILGFHSYLNELKGPEINETVLAYPDLPRELEGFTLALISDVHYGRGSSLTGLEEALERVKRAAPEVVFLAGDISDCPAKYASELAKPLSTLKNTPFGVYAVLGDRDLKKDGNPQLLNALRSAGVIPAGGRRIMVHGLPLTVMGFQDLPGEVPDLFPLDFLGREFVLDFASLKGPPPPLGNFNVIFSHRPPAISNSPSGGSLYLSGHARGGHFALPGDKDLNLAALFYDRSSGLYQSGSAYILVSRGISDSFFHLRFFARPEINIVRLTRG
ncbi:MAG: metallophosphoesterase [Deltaproteobacteria bacterium]|nr:metallophosphoesterase [Deltaproteobacteria bacterium]